jgi:hypothetical protein
MKSIMGSLMVPNTVKFVVVPVAPRKPHQKKAQATVRARSKLAPPAWYTYIIINMMVRVARRVTGDFESSRSWWLH